MAMRIVTSAAELLGAESLVEVSSAHIDGCLHHGDGGVEFAEALVEGGGRVAVPTTLNVGALDLLHPDVVRADHVRGHHVASVSSDAHCDRRTFLREMTTSGVISSLTR